MKNVFEYQYRIIRLCVDGYDHKALRGRFYNPYLENGIEFHSTNEFLLSVEELFELMHFPENFDEPRHFWEHGFQFNDSSPNNLLQIGRLATFDFHVYFRQNASWQGSLKWYEGKREEKFRSVLELLHLIDDAISSAKGTA